MYFAGDGARIDEDGDFWLLGRVDDVMNVSGHRISTIEVESALVDHPSVAEAAVCGRADALTGQAIVAFVTLKGGEEGSVERLEVLRNHVAQKIGPIAKPANIVFTPELPKTRSGKIMRRLLRDVAEERPLGDTTTLADPAVVAEIADRAVAQPSEEVSCTSSRRLLRTGSKAATVRVTSSSLVRQFETEMRIAARPSHVVPLIHASPLRCTASRTARVVSSSANRSSTWFEHDLVQDLAARQPRELVGEACARAGSSARRARRRPARPSERSAAYTVKPRARRENSGVQSIASRVACSSATRYSASSPSRRDAASGCATNASPQSYGTLSHLCASVAQESASLDAVDEVPERGRRRGPEPERAVDVEPRACVVRSARDLAQRIDGARVHLAHLRADDRRAVEAGERRRERAGPHPALLVDVDRRARARYRARAAAARGRPSRGACRRRRRGSAARRPARSRSTSQPARSSTACRAAARHVTCAIWQPVTNANDASPAEARAAP